MTKIHQNPIEPKPGCLQTALCIVGERWTALILRDLSHEPRTFSELELSLAGISPRTLSQRLDKLAEVAIVRKLQYSEHPPRFRYELTQKGAELEGVLIKMAEWGNKYYQA